MNNPDSEPPPKDCLTPTDLSKNPEKCLVDSFGAFVSPAGDDSNEGTTAKPFKTIGKALGTTRSRIVVCEGEYAGSLDVTRSVEIYGGVACDFAKVGGKPKIAASKAAYGIKVAKVAAAVILADLEVVGMNGAAPSESSVGVFVTESANVKVLRSRIEAGDGADSAPKRDGAFTFPSDATKLAGKMPTDLTTGGTGGDTGSCPGGGASRGGSGGNAGAVGEDGNPRPPGGLKGDANGDCAFGLGKNGTVGTPGMERPGAATVATVSPGGLAASKGQDGTPGGIGGGGGGGFGFTGAGGGGGAGGCGGEGGFGGAGGGSSVALLTFASEVAITEGTELIAKASKPGGPGGTGQAGQMGGFRGNGSGNACQGGAGAQGGTGGHGGGGAGGISAGIAWSGGKEPTKDAATKITRATGPGPVGGEGGGGAATKGVDGVHADVFEVK